tara:strand:- start:42 stop:275 length:234 start_codon:yes stop_codon:yes gene_type:complete
LKKSKLTRKEMEQAIDGLSRNDEALLKMFNNYILELRQIIALYLEWKKETDSFDKFVKEKVNEFEQQRSENKNKKGA